MSSVATIANINTNSEVGEIADPKLRKLLSRVAQEMELGIERVAANHSKPAEFPLPTDPNSTERILAARVSALPKGKQAKAAGGSRQRLNAPAATRQKRFGDLAKVNLKTDASIGSQVKTMPLPNGLSIDRKSTRLNSSH